MYRYEISKHDIKLVKEALKILTDLKAPISKNITFSYRFYTESYGFCQEIKNRFYVSYRHDIINDYYKMNIIIHEILHTVPEESYWFCHKGEWAKWAKIVTNSTPYKIETYADSLSVKYSGKKIPTFNAKRRHSKKVYCPYCGKQYDIPTSGKNYWCPKCIKPLSDSPLNDELTNLSVKERQNEISLRMSNLNMETAPKLLLYANKINTRKIIIHLMLEYPLDNNLKAIIKPYINMYTKQKITELCDKGAFNKFITSFTNMYNYENISNTKADLFKVYLDSFKIKCQY